ncbi:MAG: methyl-accepting chemotaxis protein [Brevinematales bacterium]|jgi:methyl-accepting chemotaxis protein
MTLKTFAVSLVMSLLSLAMLHAEYSINQGDQVFYLTNMSILESPYSPGSHITDEPDAPGFIQYNSGSLPVTIKNTRRMYTFRENIKIDPSLSNILLSLYLGPSSYPYDVYINGKLVLTRGSRDKNYQASSYETLIVQLSADLLNYGQINNELAIQAYPKVETGPIEAPMIMPDLMAQKMAFFRNLFSIHFIQAVFIIGILIGLYFLSHYAVRKFSDLQFLYFALTCFFFSFCYYNISFSYNLTDEFYLEKVSRFSFPLTLLFLTLFIREFTGLWKNFFMIILLAILPAAASINLLLKKDIFSLDGFFNQVVMLYIIAPYLFLSLTMLAIAYLKSFKTKFLILILSYMVIFGASAHDIYYIIIKEAPFCWMAPYGYLTMVVSVFIILAIEESTLYDESMRRSREIDIKNNAMKTIIRKIEIVSGNLERSSRSLGENIGKASMVIRNSSDNNRTISDRIIKELQGIEGIISQITSRMEISVEKIPEAISGQTAAVEETNRTVSSMNSHIERILQATDKTNIIAQELSKLASTGRDIVLKSKESIKEVSLNSQFISEILFNIREIVEESNFLSINASIESAHAGETGKGFSILANEIRELANKSRERLEMSQDRLKQMITFIDESISLSEQVTGSLLTIMDKSQDSAGMISKITEQMRGHKEEFGDILKGSDSLLQDSFSIKSMSDQERKENESLKQSLSSLRESFIETTALLSSQMESENNIREAIDRIQEVLGENLNVMDILKDSVKIGSTITF